MLMRFNSVVGHALQQPHVLQGEQTPDVSGSVAKSLERETLHETWKDWKERPGKPGQRDLEGNLESLETAA